MNTTLLYIVSSSVVVSLLALLGIVIVDIQSTWFSKSLMYLVALSAGTMIGGVFLHLLPEAAENFEDTTYFTLALISFVLFFLIEKGLHWHHCHDEECEKHTYGQMTLFGDSVHNFIDGLLIAGAYITDINLGIATTAAIALHELPQEIGDFGVLVHSGFTKKKALLVNFLVALAALAGALVGFYVSESIEGITKYAIPLAAGGFLYIATSDLIPEIREETNTKKSIGALIAFFTGILLMYAMLFLE
ncbi:MAG: ZIP family metal transporter [Patescibacteria group bacterium]